MSETRIFALPDVGEGLTEAEIVRWRVAPGDRVAVNDPVVDIETAKAVVELPSPFSGIVAELLAPEGRVISVGSPILAVAVEGSPAPSRSPVLIGYGVMEDTPHAVAPSVTTPPTSPIREASRHSNGAGERVRAKPPVRALARDLGVDLSTVTPTGPHGDVTREDVRARAGGTGDQIAVRGVRRAMAEAMVRSASTAVAVSIFTEVDVSATLRALDQLKADPRCAQIKITPLTFAALAVVHAVRRTPIVNSSWRQEAEGEAHIEVHREVNLGIAVAGPRGLVVPNIRGAQGLNAPAMAAAIAQLTQRAREDALTPADSLGGTITITNIGVFDIDGGTPILNPGEAAILATGRIMERPWVVDGGLAVRPVMHLSLTFDHRIVDGAAGATFLSDVARFLGESPLGLPTAVA